MSVPDTYELFAASPFGELVGPLYAGHRGSVPTLAVRVGSEHGNRSGRAHGGLMMTIADIAVSRAAREQLPPGARVATADLHIAFLESVGEGDWLEAIPSIERVGRSLVHGSCVLEAGARTVARVLATIAVLPA
ncbi:MAG TPA: PaaI family thioesterase [Solirubrobacteraceae bacterium]|nr:PaaI family thioesterase [Solirubrobacteraceae bacterium]